jgi:hypothetical protein
MRHGRRLILSGIAAALVSVLAPVPPAAGQGLENTLHAGPRVFPTVGPGVAALKRDSAGRYYILAEPATAILVFDASGKPAGQIPNADSKGATIRYAVDIDIDVRDRLFVADRGANAIKIFSADGSLAATIPVNAPTSVAVLPGGQFAVTSLLSKRLVQIMDETGAVVRAFGDPADVSSDAPSSQSAIVDRGRVIGDSSGNIYFAFKSLPDPTLQRFDRFGYSAYQTVVPQSAFGTPHGRDARVEVGYTMSELGWPTTFSAWTDLHSLTSLSAANGARRGRRGQAAAQNASSSSAASSSSPPGSQSSSSTDSTDSSAPPAGAVDADGNTLEFSAGDVSGASDSTDTVTAYLDNPTMGPGLMTSGMFGMGIGGFFHGAFGGFHADGGEGGGGFGGAESFEGGSHPDFAGHAVGVGESARGFEGGHFRSGIDTYRARATVRLRLDNPAAGAEGNPVISAIGIDPASHEVWAAIGDTLVHFDSSGARLDMYYLVLTDEAALKPTSILVEPNRLLIAADPFGVYEFPRPDRPSSVASPTEHSLVPQQLPSAPSSSHKTSRSTD